MLIPPVQLLFNESRDELYLGIIFIIEGTMFVRTRTGDETTATRHVPAQSCCR